VRPASTDAEPGNPAGDAEIANFPAACARADFSITSVSRPCRFGASRETDFLSIEIGSSGGTTTTISARLKLRRNLTGDSVSPPTRPFPNTISACRSSRCDIMSAIPASTRAAATIAATRSGPVSISSTAFHSRGSTVHKVAEQDSYSEEEGSRRYAATLKRIIATRPDHKRNVKSDASPKKRGRPPKLPIATDK
jgi:hypothetical protein